MPNIKSAMWSDELIAFYGSLKPAKNLPNGVHWLYPQQSPEVVAVAATFFHKYFDDEVPRHLIMGINPGRFGAGVTGVNFTAPKQLTHNLHINHSFKQHSELSAEFVYRVIDAFGGPEAFYRRFFISSICPLGFVKNGININYYDDKELMVKVAPFIARSMKLLLQSNVSRDTCFCMGGDKNYKHLLAFNKKYGWFEKIVPLPHPRFIMQYRRRFVDEYVHLYLEALRGER